MPSDRPDGRGGMTDSGSVLIMLAAILCMLAMIAIVIADARGL